MNFSNGLSNGIKFSGTTLSSCKSVKMVDPNVTGRNPIK